MKRTKKKIGKVILIFIIVLLSLVFTSPIILGLVIIGKYYYEDYKIDSNYVETRNIFDDTIKCLRTKETNEYGTFYPLKIENDPDGITSKIYRYYIIDCKEFLDKDNLEITIFLERDQFYKKRMVIFYTLYSDSNKDVVQDQCTYLYDLQSNKLYFYYDINSYYLKEIVLDDIYEIVKTWCCGYLYYDRDNMGNYKYEEICGTFTYENNENLK